MSLVTVYAYEFFNAEQGIYQRADPLATLEIIEAKGWRPIRTVSLEVDSSQLSDGGRFHLPSNAITGKLDREVAVLKSA